MIVKPPTHRFVLKGFSQKREIRHFRFEDIDENNVRTAVTVDADLGLIQIYGIQIQELPLLCLELLMRHADALGDRVLIFTEQEMSQVRMNRKTAREDANQKQKNKLFKSPKSPQLYRDFNL